MTVDDLVTWLRAQLDDDEQVAREADPETTAEDLEFGDSPSVWTDPHGEFQGRGGPVFAHVLRHDPARVLAEVDAKRRIIDLYDVSTSRELKPDAWELMKHAVRAVALPYADRPGYRDEWKP